MDNPGFEYDEVPVRSEADLQILQLASLASELEIPNSTLPLKGHNCWSRFVQAKNFFGTCHRDSHSVKCLIAQCTFEHRKLPSDSITDSQTSSKFRETSLKKSNHIPAKMPANSEETALLSLLPIDSMDDIELKNIQLQFPSSRRFSDSSCQELRVHTDRGDIMVAVQGDRSKPAIVTYHDLGLNYTSFQPFFNYVDMRALLENFCVYHVNAPGQEEGAPTLPEDYVYPTMDELANQLNYVLVHFGIKNIIGFGVGVGANILARFALSNPEKVDALTLINCSATQAGWIEWASHKMNSRALRSRGMTPAAIDYLMWYHFGRCPEERNPDLVQMYRTYFRRHVNPGNLAMLVESYARRSDLGIARDAATLRAPVLNLTAALSPHVDQTVALNARLCPSNSTWMKISDAAMVLEEQPGKVSEAFRLFLQGEGYARTQVGPPRSRRSRPSLSSRRAPGATVANKDSAVPASVGRASSVPPLARHSHHGESHI
ncbi:unnamed protein product, partial [Brenthis ino]